jgi:ankyrin repeat protein
MKTTILSLFLLITLLCRPAFCGEIHDAAANGDLEKVKALLKDNPDLVSSKDNTSWQPMHWAAYNGHKDMVELLLANKADINAKDKNGMSALGLAAGKGHMDVANLLIVDKAEYTIHDVAALGDLERTRALLKDHPELANSTDGDGHTPLGLAANKDVAELLLANKADPNYRDGFFQQTPLFNAAADGRRDVVELLLAKGANANDRGNFGITVLHLAAINGHKDVVKLLIANKADYNIYDASAIGDLETVKKLLQADPSLALSADTQRQTALHWAAWRDCKDVAEFLLDHKADVNAKNLNGYTPLHLAVSGNHKDVAELLRQHGGQE